MKNIVLVLGFFILFTSHIQADTVGLHLGGHLWQNQANGIIREEKRDENTRRNINLKKETQKHYFLAAEHPFPVLPNIRISLTKLDSASNIHLIEALNFNNVIFPVGSTISTKFKLHYLDYTFYYQISDKNAFSLDLGVTLRSLDHDVALTGSEITINIDTGAPVTDDDCADPWQDRPCAIRTTTHEPVSNTKSHETLPMLYMATKIELPLDNLSAFIQSDVSLKNKHSVHNYQIGLIYNLVKNRRMDMSFTLGYQIMNIKHQKLDSLSTDLKFSGIHTGLALRF